MADTRSKMAALLKANMQWDRLEPMFIEIYCKSFSQKDVDAMLTFYESKSGQAVIAKMSVVTQQTIQAVQSQMAGLTPQIQQIVRESTEKMMATTPKAGS